MIIVCHCLKNMELGIISNPREILEQWRLETKRFSDIHRVHEDNYGKKNKILTIISIILSSIVGLTSFLPNKETYLEIIFGSLSILSGILQAITKFLKYETLEIKHKELSVEYLNLSQDILIYASMYSDEKILAEFEDIRSRMNNLIQKSPSGVN